MASNGVLEDINQTAAYIPYQEEDTRADHDSYTLFPDRDLPNGYELRLEAYRAAWLKCLTRIQDLTRALHAPVVDRVSELVNKSYIDILPGLPYPELPVISVSTNGVSSSFLDEITSQLEGRDDDALFGDANSGHLVTHIFPSDCPNVSSAMKTLVTGFITKYERELGSGKRKPGNSLSTMDLNLLQAWFDALLRVRDSNESEVRLVIVLHDFEQFEPPVVQDLFEICSLAIPRLPLVFVLLLASPPSPSYIHMTYPRRILSLLQVRTCVFPWSNDVLHEILLKTFFDVDFEPELMIGPVLIDFLADFFERHSVSLDSLVSILQLAHMKHFEEPLTVFLHNERLGPSDAGNSVLGEPASFGFLEALFTRVRNARDANNHKEWLNTSIDDLLSTVRTARKTFRSRVRLLRVALQVILLIRAFMLSEGYKVEATLSELMCGAMRGRIQNVTKYLCTMVKKLRKVQINRLLPELRDFFASLPDKVRAAEKAISSQIDTAFSARDDEAHVVAGLLSEWLMAYFEERIVSLEDTPLWDIWYTGSTPFPTDLVNPSIRASILAGLLHPQEFSASVAANGRSTHNTEDDGEDEDDSLLHMPDTSILFQRYLESGKMINVYDWFESFAVVLEEQKRHHQRTQSRNLPERNGRPSTPRTPRTPRTPTRHSRGGKGRQWKEQDSDDPPEQQAEEETEENWRLEVQARFIRALHELDYVGFIRHTGRRADHVMRTVFDTPISE
ncbi:origin recognition complex subunit 3 N-terminus-domain-containing protein [Pisolithus thermaeus]|nr:origin recognition complex subunit 3 N-terminus-domain-containing protein [Pisolithus croceorrhizus]KAI6163562.1 origin recognition complex subunit 3 N-terminus-domain-containing protein [Pisolithus thermaeus]